MKSIITSAMAMVLLFATQAMGQQEKNEVPKADAPGDVKPGDTALLRTDGEYPMDYFMRVPKSYDSDKGARVIVFMHGSNMNGLNYLRSFEGAGWCEDDILVCPNGEVGDDPYGANNFTFVSANYIKPVTEQVVDAFKATRIYIGGHSQGGFLTYSVIMYFPELYDGAFPMAADCWMQNEPNQWESKPEKVAKQKDVAIAVIHGQSDSVVNYSQGEHAHNVFLASGYPKLRFFNPERLGHQFMLSPVNEALDWLDAMNGDNPEHSLKLTKKWGKDKEWGWAHQTALALLERDDLDDDTRAAAEKINKAMEFQAKKVIPEMSMAINEAAAEEWIPQWYEFRRQFGATAAAKRLVDEYDKKREEQRDKAKELFFAARGDFQNEKKTDGYAKLEEILKDYPCTYHAYYAMDWLEDRTDKPKKKGDAEKGKSKKNR